MNETDEMKAPETKPIDPLSKEGLEQLKNAQFDIKLVTVPVDDIRRLLDIIRVLATEVERLRTPSEPSLP